jgi:hypothetical protein
MVYHIQIYTAVAANLQIAQIVPSHRPGNELAADTGLCLKRYLFVPIVDSNIGEIINDLAIHLNRATAAGISIDKQLK